MSDTNSDDWMDREYEDLLAEEDVIGRINDLIEEIEEARYEICLADPHTRYPDSSMHFGQITEHLKAIKFFIQYRQRYGTNGLSTYSLYQHSTLCTVLEDEDEIERLYEEGIGS